MMFNPLLNASALSDSDLEKKIQELTSKYFQTNNGDVKVQIMNFLDIYKQELNDRRARAWEKQFQKSNKGLDNLINVN
jgi:hypothetical protein